MLQCYFFLRQIRLTKWSFLVHRTTLNAHYIHPSNDSILELWRTFPNEPTRVRFKCVVLFSAAFAERCLITKCKCVV